MTRTAMRRSAASRQLGPRNRPAHISPADPRPVGERPNRAPLGTPASLRRGLTANMRPDDGAETAALTVRGCGGYPAPLRPETRMAHVQHCVYASSWATLLIGFAPSTAESRPSQALAEARGHFTRLRTCSLAQPGGPRQSPCRSGAVSRRFTDPMGFGTSRPPRGQPNCPLRLMRRPYPGPMGPALFWSPRPSGHAGPTPTSGPGQDSTPLAAVRIGTRFLGPVRLPARAVPREPEPFLAQCDTTLALPTHDGPACTSENQANPAPALRSTPID